MQCERGVAYSRVCDAQVGWMHGAYHESFEADAAEHGRQEGEMRVHLEGPAWSPFGYHVDQVPDQFQKMVWSGKSHAQAPYIPHKFRGAICSNHNIRYANSL